MSALDYGGLAVLRDALATFRDGEAFCLCVAAVCGLCQQSETFDEEAITRLRRRPAGIVICSSALKCGFPRELVEVAALDQRVKSLGQNSAVEFNQRLLNLMQTSKET